MILIGTSKGLDSVETLKYSEELDKLIFQFQLQNRS
ncbi:aspartyl-phosphate phosphatase Spo0E family protein [Domibacillus epiphyticus]